MFVFLIENNIAAHLKFLPLSSTELSHWEPRGFVGNVWNLEKPHVLCHSWRLPLDEYKQTNETTMVLRRDLRSSESWNKQIFEISFFVIFEC
jgi:hypothetical protein